MPSRCSRDCPTTISPTARRADANSIAWLVWHIARVQDDHVAGVSGLEQVYTAHGYAERFGLPFDDRAIGYGQSSAEVAEVRAPADLLLEYLQAVHAAERRLDRDSRRRTTSTGSSTERWDPPVTLGVRLVSVADDSAQHLGQAAYVKGMLGR